jgi:hypothetical protein
VLFPPPGSAAFSSARKHEFSGVGQQFGLFRLQRARLLLVSR